MARGVGEFVLINARGALGYVFRFGDPASSPTYMARPDWYFYLWNVLTGLLFVLVLVNTVRLAKPYLSAVLVLVAFVLLASLRAESFYVLGMSRSLLLSGTIFVCIVSCAGWINPRHLTRALEVMTLAGIAFLGWQVAQYQVWGVLPSHSHEGKLIRFGSFYDDSLVFGILVPMFAGYFWSGCWGRPWREAVVVVGALSAAAMSGSLSAIAVMLMFAVWWFRRRPGWLVSLFFGAVLALTFFFDVVIDVLAFKRESISGHLDGWAVLGQVGWETLLGVAPLDVFVEAGYLSFLYNYGAIAVAMLLGLHLYTVHASAALRRRLACDDSMFRLSGAAEGASFSVLIVNLNLSPVVYPPVYLVVAVLSALVIAHAERRVGLPATSSGRDSDSS